MSSTRYAETPEGSDAAPERLLASAKLRGINIGLNVITRVARVRSPEERSAMIWLHNYARLQNLTADALSGELDLDKPVIRAALTDPDADLSRFVRQVATLRKKFEASLPTLADIEPSRVVREGLNMALRRRKIVEIVGMTREGKTVPALDWFRRNAMDRGIYFDCPSEQNDRDFFFAFLAALGISGGTNKKNNQATPQIRACFGTGMIELIVLDEGHRLWPQDLKKRPSRIEFLRSLYDARNPAQIGVAIITTPQHTISMNIALDPKAGNPRWAPGQWEGRAIPFHLPDVVSDADLRAVARHHAPDFADGMIDALVMHAKATQGFCGAMVNAIELAREKADNRGSKKVTPDILLAAQKQMVAGTKVGQAAKQIAKQRGGKITALKEAE
jgi:AAA domain